MQTRLEPRDLPELTDHALATDPVERSETIPSIWYTDPRFHSLDRDAIFGATWQAVGHSSMVSRPGEYFLTTVADNPIIVLRDKEHGLRAFYNVCRHRGGPLALEPAGCVNALTCRYHGWTYLLDGSLRGVPRFDRTELFDQRDFGLVPVRVESWEDFLFLHLGAGPAVPLEEVVGGIVERIRPNCLTTKRLVRRLEYRVEANWKLYVDNFLEGYHIPLVHPELNRAIDYLSYRTELEPWYALQHSPLKADNVYTRDQGGQAFYYWIYPNFMLNVLPHRVQVNLVVPEAHDACRIIFWYYYDDPDQPGQTARIDEDLALSEQIQHEDAEICRRVQQGLGSRAYDRGRFSVEMESGVHHFQQLVKASYRQWMRGAR